MFGLDKRNIIIKYIFVVSPQKIYLSTQKVCDMLLWSDSEEDGTLDDDNDETYMPRVRAESDSSSCIEEDLSPTKKRKTS